MISSNTMSSRLHFPIYSRGPHRNCPRQLISRYCTPRHILCSSTLPLRTIYRSCICHYRRVCPLIPTILRLHTQPSLSKNPLPHHICRRKHNILPTTFPRPIWNATTLFRLPRCIYHMKHRIFHRLLHFPNSSNSYSFHNLRSLRIKTRGLNRRTINIKPRMITRMSSAISYI